MNEKFIKNEQFPIFKKKMFVCYKYYILHEAMLTLIK
jgi:hypothetical protein